MKSVLILFDNVISLYIWILIINVIISWLVAFNVLNTSNRFVYTLFLVSFISNTSFLISSLNNSASFFPSMIIVKINLVQTFQKLNF